MFAVVLVVVAALLPLAAGGGSVAADQADIDAARAEAQAAADAFTAAENQLLDVQDAVARTDQQVQATRQTYDAVRRAVSDELVERYVRAGVGDVPIVADDLNTQARASALSRAAQGKARSQADQLGATKVLLDRQLADLARRKQEVEEQRQALADQQDALFARLRELEELEAQRQEAERQAEQARREAEAAAAQQAYEASQSSSGGGGGGSNQPAPARPVVPVDWLCPITGGYSFSDTWGAARSNGRSHKGTDMFANYGTPLVAVVSGKAVDYGWEDAGGNGVFLLGDDGNRYFYAHLQDFGQLGRVQQGDVVGYVGDTGNATGTPHLHFEIHPGGSGWTNPYPTLIQYC